MRVDLHVHSLFSDGSQHPMEIVQAAMKREVSILSICDHYTIDAYDALLSACKSNNIKAVLGVELDAIWEDESFHVLAYNFNRENSQIIEFIRLQHDKSEAECENIVTAMSRDYPQMSLEDYRNYNPPIKGGWKYIHYAVEKRVAKTYEEASYFYEKYSKPDPRTFELSDFCEIVKSAGGVPILAHPGYIYNRNPDKYENVLKSMLDCGIQGIECYYPSHSLDAVKHSVEFCNRNNLCITAGCDCHGEYDKSEGFTVGGMDVNPDMLSLKGII
jgi:predicted metal-dependent phosphoesterase TrpH